MSGDRRGSNILLVGFMGAGKSTVGRRLARQLGYDFTDLDQLIVAREGRSIPELFSAYGEAHFRDRESAALADQSNAQRTVFATGGGVVGRPENRAMLKALGQVVYLRAAWSTIEKRLRRGTGRPLADPQNGWETVRQLWSSRLAWYEEADLIIDTDDLRVPDVVQQIIAGLKCKELPPCSR